MKPVCVNCFRNLGVESRIRIYMYLSQHKGKNVSDITRYVGLKQPTVSYHLSEMLKSGLLSKQVEGKQVYYTVNHKCPHDSEVCCISKPSYV